MIMRKLIVILHTYKITVIIDRLGQKRRERREMRKEDNEEDDKDTENEIDKEKSDYIKTVIRIGKIYNEKNDNKIYRQEIWC